MRPASPSGWPPSSEIGGTVKFEETTKGSLLNIIVTAPDGDTRTYAVPHTGLLVKDGDVIEAGHQLTYGALNPHEVLRIRGADAVYNYLIQEVLRVYRQQGVDINDKHIEIIVRQMMRKVRLEDAGDTKLLDGSMVDVLELDDANEEIDRRNAAGERQENGEPLRHAAGTQLLMGITKASLATDSFLSAASFQETTKVLTEAAIKGKSDHLVGLKENVIIGKLIPAGTGLTAYHTFAEELRPRSGARPRPGGGAARPRGAVSPRPTVRTTRKPDRAVRLPLYYSGIAGERPGAGHGEGLRPVGGVGGGPRRKEAPLRKRRRSGRKSLGPTEFFMEKRLDGASPPWYNSKLRGY